MTSATSPRVTVDGDTLQVRVPGGPVVALHAFALRDSCTCRECRHPLSGQRLFETHRVIPKTRLAGAMLDDDGELAIDWADGHRSVFASEWIVAEAEAAATRERPRRPQTLWGAGIEPVREDYETLTRSTSALRRLLGAVAEEGFAIVTGAPTVEGSVALVARLFGPVRVTNYGRVFDVSVRVDAANLADTSMALSLHTDNPYRDPPPGIQFLHCLASNVTGGDTVLADGFRAVTALAARSPALVDLLARTPVRFAYRDDQAELEADTTIIELDALGRVRALHLNNRSKGVPAGPPEVVRRWYEAYVELLDVLEAPESRVSFRLAPGDTVVFDNLRVLHARTGFSGEGMRHLQGCYADRDALLSTLAVLERRAV